ncbi:MAG: heavy-metal-associated domain-containing protein [Deltaproteobacteria bacterium]|nr:heavy-metal-associated domain-containing protein [Candidatus Anaeroferrophillus wilburensis]MBN2887924.1 heavy-metal-associated domain-containing protein [Deltaproteobacteria bacterium]
MTTINVNGMSCQHCVRAVGEILSGFPGVSEITVDLETGDVSFMETEPVDRQLLAEKLAAAGYSLG